MAVPETGSIFLPGSLVDWVNANGGETISTTTSPLRLDYNHWNRIPTWENNASYDRFVFLNIHIDDGNVSDNNNEHREIYRKVGMIPSADTSSEYPDVQMIDLHNPSRTKHVERCIISL